jgi:thioredoxin reductase (NADPH)
MTENSFDLMIVGAGPAGGTAAIYAQRLGLNSVVFGDIPGGSTYMIENLANFPGFTGGVPGTQFGLITFQQAQQEGAVCAMSRLEHLGCANGKFEAIDANGQTYSAPAAVMATGRVPKRLAVAKANLDGVHFCSICDGPLYRGKEATLAVVGSDNAAAQHALSLARVAHKVLLICRSQQVLMDVAHRNLIRNQAKIQLMPETEVVAYEGLQLLETLVLKKGDAEEHLKVDGLFLAIGWIPNTQMLTMDVAATAEGYLKTDDRLMTSIPGLFAAGDVRDTDMWQVLTACADGARTAKHVADYLEGIG